MFRVTRRERFASWLHQRRDETLCFLLNHSWETYETRGFKTGRDGIDRVHVYTNLRCTRCGLEYSMYAGIDEIPLTLPDRLRYGMVWTRPLWMVLSDLWTRRRRGRERDDSDFRF